MSTPKKWCAEQAEDLTERYGFDPGNGWAQVEGAVTTLGRLTKDGIPQMGTPQHDRYVKALYRLFAYGAFQFLDNASRK